MPIISNDLPYGSVTISTHLLITKDRTAREVLSNATYAMKIPLHGLRYIGFFKKMLSHILLVTCIFPHSSPL